MSMSYWEYRSEAINDVAALVQRALSKELEPYAALEAIEQVTFECEAAYEDGSQVSDAELTERLAEQYGEPREPSWVRFATR
jgi:hypothetical protein